VVIGYVVMPEHIHLLLSEPEVGTISTVMQVLKQRTARALLPKVKPDPLCATHPSQKAREGRATRPGGRTAVYVAGTTGPLYYRHADWLGSSRLASTQSRTKYFDVSYAPFGEDYNDLGTTDYNFTGQNQYTETGYYDFLFREYSPVQGRWLSPDPAGTAAADPTNPQSWNRYVYVLNNPLALVDPLGLDCVYLTDDGGHVQEIDHEAINDGECAASGGYWIEGSVNDPSWVTIDSDAGTVSGYGVTVDGFLELSVAGAMGTNPFGAWTQTFSLDTTIVNVTDSSTNPRVGTLNPNAVIVFSKVANSLSLLTANPSWNTKQCEFLDWASGGLSVIAVFNAENPVGPITGFSGAGLWVVSKFGNC
jgi:RHS repeat-associated protein